MKKNIIYICYIIFIFITLYSLPCLVYCGFVNWITIQVYKRNAEKASMFSNTYVMIGMMRAHPSILHIKNIHANNYIGYKSPFGSTSIPAAFSCIMQESFGPGVIG